MSAASVVRESEFCRGELVDLLEGYDGGFVVKFELYKFNRLLKRPFRFHWRKWGNISAKQTINVNFSLYFVFTLNRLTLLILTIILGIIRN